MTKPPQVIPVLGGEVVEGQQRVAVLHQASHRPVVFGAMFVGKRRDRRRGRRAFWYRHAAQIEDWQQGIQAPMAYRLLQEFRQASTRLDTPLYSICSDSGTRFRPGCYRPPLSYPGFRPTSFGRLRSAEEVGSLYERVHGVMDSYRNNLMPPDLHSSSKSFTDYSDFFMESYKQSRAEIEFCMRQAEEANKQYLTIAAALIIGSMTGSHLHLNQLSALCCLTPVFTVAFAQRKAFYFKLLERNVVFIRAEIKWYLEASTQSDGVSKVGNGKALGFDSWNWWSSEPGVKKDLQNLAGCSSFFVLQIPAIISLLLVLLCHKMIL
jgi:hypothetical protein